MKGLLLTVFSMFAACGLSHEAKAKMILESGLKDPSPIIRIHAAVALNGESGKKVLVEMLHIDEDDVVAAALDAALGNATLVPEAEIYRACSSANPSVREAAYRLAVEKDGTGMRRLLIQGIQDRVAGVRETSYTGLARIGEIDILKRGLHDPDAGVRIAVAKEAGKQGLTGMPEFIRVELAKSTPDLLGVGMIALAELGDTASVPLFNGLLKESAGELRVDAAEALLILGDDAGVNILKKSLRANDPFVRIRAVSVLTRHDIPGMTDELASAVKDEFFNVAVLALRALAAHDARGQRQQFLELMNGQNPLLRIEAAAAYLRSLDGA